MGEGGQVDEDEGEGEEENEGQASAAWHRPCVVCSRCIVWVLKVENVMGNSKMIPFCAVRLAVRTKLPAGVCPFPSQLLTSYILLRVNNVFPAIYTAMLKHLRLMGLKYTQISLLFATVFNLNHIQQHLRALTVIYLSNIEEGSITFLPMPPFQICQTWFEH